MIGAVLIISFLVVLGLFGGILVAATVADIGRATYRFCRQHPPRLRLHRRKRDVGTVERLGKVWDLPACRDKFVSGEISLERYLRHARSAALVLEEEKYKAGAQELLEWDADMDRRFPRLPSTRPRPEKVRFLDPKTLIDAARRQETADIDWRHVIVPTNAFSWNNDYTGRYIGSSLTPCAPYAPQHSVKMWRDGKLEDL